MSPPAFTYSIKTMGCKANIYDSLILERELCELGGERDDKTPDIFVLNSCTVTAEADKQSHREVGLVRKRAPSAYSIVTGCYAQVEADKVARDPLVDRVIRNDQKGSLKKAVADKLGIVLDRHEPDPEIYWGQLPIKKGKTRAFIKIQEGCNDYCTYCIIPYARGKSRSVPTALILDEIRRLCDLGIKEVVLTGTNIGDYGKDLQSSLEELIDSILEQTLIPRLRLTSLDPTEISDRILNAMGEGSRLMPHFHVSLQSPVSRVLRAMKRDYRKEEVASALWRIYEKSPEIYVGMDMIAGFPSETDVEHQEAMKTLTDLPWTRLHVFPYSEREGTPATRIPESVPVAVRRQRAQELMQFSHSRHKAFTDRFLGQKLSNVLFETWYEAAGDYFVAGHAENYSRVMAKTSARTSEEAKLFLNKMAHVWVVGAAPQPAQDWTLEAVVLD
ncbi:MAG: tRNA (N(6)-L-threonylcarbamoyladenosine(37)-C(2))-methylthiotransferase MtaB [Bdellovibrionota bacterium]